MGVSPKQAYRYLACELMGKAGQQAAVDSFVKYNYRFVVNDDVAKIRLEVRQSWGGEGGRASSKDEVLAGLDAALADPANPYLHALWERPRAPQAWLGPQAPFAVLACMADYYRLRGYGSDELQALRHRFDRYRAGFVRTGGAEHARRALRLLLLSTLFGPGDDSAHSGTVGVERAAWRQRWAGGSSRWSPTLALPTAPPRSYRPHKGPSGETRSGALARHGRRRDRHALQRGRPLRDRAQPSPRTRSARAAASSPAGGSAADGETVVPASLYSRVHAKLFFDEGRRLVLANASGTLNVRLVRAGQPHREHDRPAPGRSGRCSNPATCSC